MGGIFYIGKYNCGATDGQFKMEEIPKLKVLIAGTTIVWSNASQIGTNTVGPEN